MSFSPSPAFAHILQFLKVKSTKDHVFQVADAMPTST